MECYTSRLKILGLLGLTCAMVGMSYALATLPDLIPRVVGWIGVIFFGLGFIALPVQFFRVGPQVIINHEGIEDRRHKIGVIRWEDIRSLSIGSVNSARFLCIEVAHPESYTSKLPRLGRSLVPVSQAMGFPALTIGFSVLSPGLKEVWAYLETRHSMLTGGGLPDAASRQPQRRWAVLMEGVQVIREAALKIAALFSYCGGPLFIADLLKPRLNTGLAISITMLPVLLMVVGALCLDDYSRNRWSLAAVRAGRQGLYVVLGMHAYALWRFAEGVRVPDQRLHYIGIAVGMAWSFAYLRAARRWASSSGIATAIIAVMLTAPAHAGEPDFARWFAGRDGCFELYDLKTDKLVVRSNPERCAKRLSPCSTFKVPLALMAFDAGVLKNEASGMKWDGTKTPREEWNRDQTAASWMRRSVVWFSQRLTPQLGMRRVRAYLSRFDYGNQDMSGGLTKAWLQSSLLVSPDEQLRFWKRFWREELPVSKHAYAMTKKITLVERSPSGWTLHGKTGSGATVAPDGDSVLGLGWFVGYVARGNRDYLFVTCYSDRGPSADRRPPGFVAREITTKILGEMGLY